MRNTDRQHSWHEHPNGRHANACCFPERPEIATLVVQVLDRGPGLEAMSRYELWWLAHANQTLAQEVLTLAASATAGADAVAWAARALACAQQRRPGGPGRCRRWWPACWLCAAIRLEVHGALGLSP
jgi:hypothetical protein